MVWDVLYEEIDHYNVMYIVYKPTIMAMLSVAYYCAYLPINQIYHICPNKSANITVENCDRFSSNSLEGIYFVQHSKGQMYVLLKCFSEISYFY